MRRKRIMDSGHPWRCPDAGRHGCWAGPARGAAVDTASLASARHGAPSLEIGRQVQYRQAAVERWLTGSIQAGSPRRTGSTPKPFSRFHAASASRFVARSPDHAGRLACSSCVTAEQPAAFLKGRHHLPLAAMTAQPQCPRRRDGGHRLQHLPVRCRRHPDLCRGGRGLRVHLNTVGIILMVGGLLGLFASVLLWSSFSPWSRRRTVVGGDTVVEERRIERAISLDLPRR
jgi:hypothetical protein